MADKDQKDLPIREQDDGTVLVHVGEDQDPFEGEGEGEKFADGGRVNAEDDGGGEENDDDGGGSEEDRERIREARREERKLKKDLQKQREASSKHKISALERRNEDLARRLAAVESTASSYQFAQVDKAVEDEATRVEFARMKLMQASEAGDANAQAEYLEMLQDAKTRLSQITAYKKQQLEYAKRPPQNVPNPAGEVIKQNASSWLGKNKWYDPQARDTDSRIAKVIDNELAADGWDPADPEYWDELDNRLSARLPHRYSSRGGNSSNSRSRPNATASGRSESANGKSTTTITLSRERVQAIKDSGSWDDAAKRNKMIQAYARFDKENRRAA